jgi:hypothetical protein
LLNERCDILGFTLMQITTADNYQPYNNIWQSPAVLTQSLYFGLVDYENIKKLIQI